MRLTAAAVALLALAACGGSKTPGATPSNGTNGTSGPPRTTSLRTPAGPPKGCHVTQAPSGTTIVTATVTGKTVSTAHAVWSVKVGAPVRIAVTADRADEVHVHEYDKKQDTKPGCPTEIDFSATIPGTVEVELENAGLHLFDLQAS
jgi:copper(I)-binding protein